MFWRWITADRCAAELLEVSFSLLIAIREALVEYDRRGDVWGGRDSL